MLVSPPHAAGTHRSPREIARDIGTSHRTVRRIIAEDLDMRYFTRLAVHALTDAQKTERVVRCRAWLRPHGRINDVNTMLFSDEKVSKSGGVVNILF